MLHGWLFERADIDFMLAVILGFVGNWTKAKFPMVFMFVLLRVLCSFWLTKCLKRLYVADLKKVLEVERKRLDADN